MAAIYGFVQSFDEWNSSKEISIVHFTLCKAHECVWPRQRVCWVAACSRKPEPLWVLTPLMLNAGVAGIWFVICPAG